MPRFFQRLAGTELNGREFLVRNNQSNEIYFLENISYVFGVALSTSSLSRRNEKMTSIFIKILLSSRPILRYVNQ